MRISFTRELPGEIQSALAPYFSEIAVFEKGRPLLPTELEEVFAISDVVVCTIMDRVDSNLLFKAKKLRLLITYSVGMDHIHLPALKEKRVFLSHTPGALTEATAELAWALILGCARRIKPAAEYLNSGKFIGIAPKLFLGRQLRGTKLGIFGMGRIGRAVAEKGRAFGMEILYTNRSEVAVAGAKALSFEELLRQSDILSIHSPLNAETRGIFNASALRKMKPNAILINTARGPIHCERDLKVHLQAFPDFSAGLDVFEQEPVVESGLLALPNALCVPHIGSATHEARGAMAGICMEEAIRFAKGEPLRYGVVL